MPDGLALMLALIGLAATLAVAVAQPPRFSESVVAVLAAAVLVVTGALSIGSARHAVADLAPTIGFLAALVLISDGCRREGLFDALGAMMARGSQGSPRRLLVFVFIVAAGVTAALGLGDEKTEDVVGQDAQRLRKLSLGNMTL